MIWLYTTKITPRLQWAAEWLGLQLSGKAWTLTDNAASIGASDAVITYAAEPLDHDNQFWIAACGLMHDEFVRPQKLHATTWLQLPAFFPVSQGDIAFDLIAASFYLLQRYEEYLPHDDDAYGRYSHTNSFAFRQGFLHRPLADEWMNALRILLQQKFPDEIFVQTPFRHLPTYDVDMAWSYQHKGWQRNLGGLGKTLLQGNMEAANSRIKILTGNAKDPFDIFDDLLDLHAGVASTPIYFWLLAENQKGYDKNIAPGNTALQQLIKRMHQQAKSGIHLSWQASADGRLMTNECDVLENILQQPISLNRFHYLNFHLPDTYRRMLQHCPHITDDYSMAYGTINGFRASTSRPYRWYNIVAEQSSSLILHPAAWMDANCIFEEKLTPTEALAQWQQLQQYVVNTGGDFITIAHNHFLGYDDTGRLWWKAYTDAMRQ